MKTFSFAARQLAGPYRQRGVTLFAVLVLVMLSMLLVLWASRTSLFNEMVVGNDVDYQRTFEAAQALLQDAKLDISGQNIYGVTCTPEPGNPNICRQDPKLMQFPIENQDVTSLLATLEAQANTARLPAPSCRDGLCTKNPGQPDFWNNPQILAAMTKPGIGARYGQYTNAQPNSGQNAQQGNPVLQKSGPNNRPDEGGWYWIEVLPYVPDADRSSLVAGSPKLIPLKLMPNVLYRITALARGQKPGTQVVLQETYARQQPQD